MRTSAIHQHVQIVIQKLHKVLKHPASPSSYRFHVFASTDGRTPSSSLVSAGMQSPSCLGSMSAPEAHHRKTSIDSPLACTPSSLSSRSSSRSTSHFPLPKTSIGQFSRETLHWHTCTACAEDPLVPAHSVSSFAASTVPASGKRTSHRVHHRSEPVQLQRSLFRPWAFRNE